MSRVEARWVVVLADGRRVLSEAVTWDYAGVSVTKPQPGSSWATGERKPDILPDFSLFPWPAVREIKDFRAAWDRQVREDDEAVMRVSG